MTISDPIRVMDNGAVGGATAAHQVTTNEILANTLRAENAALSSVNDSDTSVTLLAENPNRLGVIIFNDSTEKLYVKYGLTASLTSFTTIVGVGAIWEMPRPVYVGRIDGIWAANSTGAARITELS